jgi:putative acetyltransferase
MEIEVRLACPSDAEAIAVAHRDSIHSIGPGFYPEDVVEAWASGLNAAVYINAMHGGEVFFIAVGDIDNKPAVLGFSSDYRIEGSRHGTSVYVRGSMARHGIGSTLQRAAEAHAVANGASKIEIQASLAAVEFYKHHGFEELSRGETRLMSGLPIACVYMNKTLTAINSTLG